MIEYACKAQLNGGMKANVTAATLLLCGGTFTSPARTCLQHRSLRSKQRQSSMAETKESAMEDENNMNSNITSDVDTDTEPQKIWCRKGRTGIPSFGFGLRSQTPTRQR